MVSQNGVPETEHSIVQLSSSDVAGAVSRPAADVEMSPTIYGSPRNIGITERNGITYASGRLATRSRIRSSKLLV